MVAAELERLLPVPLARLADLARTAQEQVDPELIERVRLRIAMLIGHPDGAAVPELAEWPTSERYDERDRACLGFAEQFVIDVGGVTDADVAAVAEHFTPGGLYAFVNAVWVLDLGQRLDLVSRELFR